MKRKMVACVSVSVCVKTPDGVSKPTPFFPITIPTNEEFCQQWHKWIYKKVLRRYKRNKERAEDTVQSAIQRLLLKDTIGRWFFKHLKDELVDRPEAERILGLTTEAERAQGVSKIEFISQVSPVHGRRGDKNSLWRVSDLLKYARFDYERYYYSIQNHTIDSEKVLRLLGYAEQNDKGEWVVSSDKVSVLESLYRQGRLKPSELTEHDCTEGSESVPDAVPHLGYCKHEECVDQVAKKISLGFCNKHAQHRVCSDPGCGKVHFSRGYCNVHYAKSRTTKCIGCEHGRKLLSERGLSLTNRWTSPDSSAAAMKLRWKDSQLRSMLRDWRRQNLVKAAPLRIMRLSPNHGIDAGLLKYAQTIIDNHVVNEFKMLTRTDDLEHMVFNGGASPEVSSSSTMAWEGGEGDEQLEQVPVDMGAHAAFMTFEQRYDIERLVELSGLSEEEKQVVFHLDAAEEAAKDYARIQGRTVQQLNKIRSAALAKMKSVEADEAPADTSIATVAAAICRKHKVSHREMLGPGTVGGPVGARTDFFGWLHANGMSASDISSRFSIPLERVLAAIARAGRQRPEERFQLLHVG